MVWTECLHPVKCEKEKKPKQTKNNLKNRVDIVVILLM